MVDCVDGGTSGERFFRRRIVVGCVTVVKELISLQVVNEVIEGISVLGKERVAIGERKLQ